MDKLFSTIYECVLNDITQSLYNKYMNDHPEDYNKVINARNYAVRHLSQALFGLINNHLKNSGE